ncbi:uncharacterized protein K460DRAFT_270494 [Cucurbitaria berberidis CBS 394.84]|uniref:Uncharacterized protein n=1 Tax=Cucurbitaria berberidis CBS 394.84 TaxID=1168544 RepID=A0A9P4GRX5_9PLEO|nr:uncharacterized protein K460DRAFT_270494 [Cucurbitaria berberidis CBS 394.84]KAF1850240.1 hypothetical protein K460DRAFT_270494 [Cucurbitaria berberidis CBS 394.84]
MHARESKWQYFLFSFLSILAIRYASTSSYLAVPNEVLADVCQTQDQPNPIASLYPMNATGTLNGTIAVIPISLQLARKLIPKQYGILEHAYRDLLPSFPEGMYPAVLQALHDHEVQAFGYQIPDFTRTGIEFPFVDLLGDNTTSFKWAPSLLMSAGHEIALKGAMDYGTNTFPASFEPSCDAYRAVPDAKQPGTTSFSAKSADADAASITTLFSSIPELPYPLALFKNVTNQPTFADGKTCDNMIRLFNTSVTTTPNRIETVKGTVRAKIHPFDSEQEWRNVYGLRMDTAFIENNYLPCENFRGYGAQN